MKLPQIIDKENYFKTTGINMHAPQKDMGLSYANSLNADLTSGGCSGRAAHGIEKR